MHELSSCRLQILKKDHVLEESSANYDPHPLSTWLLLDLSSLEEKLQVDLTNESGNSAFLQILIPPLCVALHDHDQYAKTGEDTLIIQHSNCQSNQQMQEGDVILIQSSQRSAKCIKDSLNVTAEERARIELVTRSQSKSCEWTEARAWRITGSKCGKILCQRESTEALLKKVLYPTL